MREATTCNLSSFDAYGSLFQVRHLLGKDGAQKPMLLVNLLSYLQGAFRQGGSYTDLLLATYTKHPCTPEKPWNLILYADEVVPGNTLAVRNERKCWMIYASFQEHGQVVLQKEAAWLVLLCQRSSFVAQLEASISQVVAHVLLHIFCNPVCNPQVGGVVLKSPGGSHLRVHFKLGMLLQDGGAHKLVLGIKGDAGSKFCVLCKNDFCIAGTRNAEESEEEVVSAVTEHQQLDLATDADVLSSVERLESRRAVCSPADFKLWEQASGINYQPEGLLFNCRLREAGVLRPVSQYCHDWMHGVCSSGTMSVCIFRLFTSLTLAGCSVWVELERYLAFWTMPGAASMTHLAELFTTKRVESYKKAHKFKAQASETLALYPLIAHFVQGVPMKYGLCLPQCIAFLAMCDLVDLLQAVPLQIVTPEMLLHAVEAALTAFANAGWAQYMTKKFHWLLHLPDHLNKFGMLPACWAMERKHKLVNRYANPTVNTLRFEQSILEEVLSHDLSTLCRPDVFDFSMGLINPHLAPEKLRSWVSRMGLHFLPEECQTGHTLRICPAGKCSRGDVVLLKSEDVAHKWEAAEVWCHLQIKHMSLSLVSIWKLLAYDRVRSCASWEARCNPILVESADILSCVTFTRTEGAATTLIPYQFRH